MFGHIVATIIGLLVVVLSGTFVTIINPLVGIPFILCGIFLLLFPNFLSNKLFDRSKGTASVASAKIPYVSRTDNASSAIVWWTAKSSPSATATKTSSRSSRA